MPTVLEENVGDMSETKAAPEQVSEPVLGVPVVEAAIPGEIAPEQAPEKYQEILSRVTPTKAVSVTDEDHADTVMLDAKHIGAMTDEEGKVQKLLDLAATKSVVHAVKVARSLKDYYALDRMHDELSGKLYQGLLERGMITKE